MGWALERRAAKRKNAHRRVMNISSHLHPLAVSVNRFFYFIFELAKGCFSGTAPLD
jgi:hypothetical protein